MAKPILYCSVEGCTERSHGHRLCKLHYGQWRTATGQVSKIICSVDNCDRPQIAKGYCTLHYQRFKTYGDPLRERPIGPGWTDPKTGYVTICVKGKPIRLHRYLAQQKIGRPLGRYEVAHHEDEIKSHNVTGNINPMPLGEHTTLHMTGRTWKVRKPRPKTGKKYTAVCSVPGCGRPFLAKDLCAMHYTRQLRSKSDSGQMSNNE